MSYAVSMIVSYFFGQKYYPINYPLKEIALYTVVAAVMFGCITFANANLPTATAIALNTVLIAAFVAMIVKRDFPLSHLPVIGRHFRK